MFIFLGRLQTLEGKTNWSIRPSASAIRVQGFKKDTSHSPAFQLQTQTPVTDLWNLAYVFEQVTYIFGHSRTAKLLTLRMSVSIVQYRTPTIHRIFCSDVYCIIFVFVLFVQSLNSSKLVLRHFHITVFCSLLLIWIHSYKAIYFFVFIIIIINFYFYSVRRYLNSCLNISLASLN